MESTETLIVGAGQAGLAISHHLTRRNHRHLVLERGRIGERWYSERWVGMHFQTPNALVTLPGFPFPTGDANGFATAAQIGDYLNAYAAHIEAPVRQNTTVTALRRTGAIFHAETADGPIQANNVVIATGPFQRPRIPALLTDAPDIHQLHAAAYRTPDALPAGAVMVIGAGASGSQIAEELLNAGRQVYFSVSRHRRAPRRYRGHDHIWWWIETGMDKTPVSQRPKDSSPLVHSGAYGGHTIDFRDFAAKGMVLLGHALSPTAQSPTHEATANGVMRFAPDLIDSLAHGDAAYHAFMDRIDAHIARKGLDLPPDPDARQTSPEPPGLRDPITEIDLRQANITSIIWATGYDLDFSWVDIPIFDARGTPRHQGGISEVPGLYFIGLTWLSQFSSSFLFGVGDDADRLATHITGRALP
jgi:putative flavoprotein involved in K+ transport